MNQLGALSAEDLQQVDVTLASWLGLAGLST